MKIRALLLAVLLGACLAAGPVQAGWQEDYQAAETAVKGKKLLEAADLLVRALEDQTMPGEIRISVRGILIRLYVSLGDYPRMIDECTKLIQGPSPWGESGPWQSVKSATLSSRANALYRLGRFAEAKTDYEAALELERENKVVMTNFAWFLATCPEEGFRDGQRALKMASEVAGQTQASRTVFNVLAAAQAEVGRFDEAVKTQERAIGMIPEGAREDLRAAYRERLAAYKAGKPWREEPVKVIR